MLNQSAQKTSDCTVYLHCEVVQNAQVNFVLTTVSGKVVVHEIAPEPWSQNSFDHLAAHSVNVNFANQKKSSRPRENGHSFACVCPLTIGSPVNGHNVVIIGVAL